MGSQSVQRSQGHCFHELIISNVEIMHFENFRATTSQIGLAF